MAKKPRIESEEPEVFQVEVITKARVAADGEWEFYVKWAGYDDDANSWEPHKNVKSCRRLLKSFFDLFPGDRSYPLGYQLNPPPEWIEKEKTYFARELAEQKADDERKKSSQSKEKKKKTKTNIRIEDSGANDSDSSSVDMPTAGQKRKLVVSSDESGESSDERPLKKGKAQASNAIASTLKPGVVEKISKQPSLHSSSQATTASSVIKHRLTHHTQQTNPLVKPMNLPVRSAAAGSLLSTKQRIFQGEITQTEIRPKLMPGKKPSVIGSLGFRKSVQSSSSLLASEAKSERPRLPSLAEIRTRASTSSSISISDTRKVADADTLLSSTMVASPVSFTRTDFGGAGTSNVPNEPLSPRTQVPGRQPQDPDLMAAVSTLLADFEDAGTLELLDPNEEPWPLQTHAQTQDPMTRVDAFLASIAPPELLAPLSETPPDNNDAEDPVPPKSLSAKVPAKKIPRKWKWNGELFVDVAKGRAERFCEIELTDTVDVQADGARFSFIFKSVDSLRVPKLYDVSDLNIILRTCGPVQQLAKMVPANATDKEPIKVLAQYMSTVKQLTCIKLSLDDTEVAVLIVFPPRLRDLCTRFSVPSSMYEKASYEGDRLIVALVPFVLSSAKYKAQEVGMPLDNILRILPALHEQDNEHPDRRYRSLISKQGFNRSASILQFSEGLKLFMSSGSPKPYCIWTSSARACNEFMVEVNMLKLVLEKYNAPEVGCDNDVRLIFVHVGALDSVHKLPALAERRAKRDEVRFFMFGTHYSVPPQRWGVREIFPIGGIMTFTPSALVDDPYGVFQLMQMVANHPLWDCYVLPSALGLYNEILNIDRESTLSLSPFLDLIQDGGVALSWTLPPGRNSSQAQAAQVNWLLESSSQSSGDLLENCITMFKDLHIAPSEQTIAMETETAEDMHYKQSQEYIADNYRRYVVIKSVSESHIPWDRDGLEWYTTDEFDFRDDYHHPLPDNVSQTI